MLKGIIELMVEKKKLERQYGHISCFDVPLIYDKMEELATEIEKDIRTEVYRHVDGHGVPKFTENALREELDTIAQEIVWGNIPEDVELHIADQDTYIEEVVCSGFNEHQQEVFDDVFYFMDSTHRAAWLRARYVDGESYVYANPMVDFIITLDL